MAAAGVETLVDVRAFPARAAIHSSTSGRCARRSRPRASPTTTRRSSAAAARTSPARTGTPCIRVAAFRYAARMTTPEWQSAFEQMVARPAPCFMCAETLWTRCHRRLIAELLVARGHELTHLLAPGRSDTHRLYDESEVRDGRLYLCGSLVA